MMFPMPGRVYARDRLLLYVAGAVMLGGVAGLVRWRCYRVPAAAVLPSLPRAFAAAMPVRVLWAWEEPEDLRALPATVGVAYLAETLLVGDRLTVVPREQPLRPAADAAVMAVVRIETRKGFADTPELERAVAAQVAGLGRQTGLRALQIDFDATDSQRGFYSGVLRAVRSQMPVDMPLSMTALVSWCGPNSWLHGLPVDEAVPMLFRMGGPRRLRAGYRLVEPLCRSSRGVAIDEPWPGDVAGLDAATRVYLFAPAPWEGAQLAAVAAAPLSQLRDDLLAERGKTR